MTLPRIPRRSFLKAGAMAGGALLTRGAARLARVSIARRPSILFCSPQGVGAGWIDLEYLRELHTQGFEVDYTESLKDITWNRIRDYNVLVLYLTPDSWAVNPNLGLDEASSPVRIRRFVRLIDRYVTAGGGIFLIPREENWKKQMLADLTDHWGAKLPMEIIVETNPANQGNLIHASYPVPLAYTEQVLPTPVSEGIKGIWYPTMPVYNAAMGGPIVVDANWQVVVKASPTAHTQPISPQGKSDLLPHPFQPAPVNAPALFALRQKGAGRIALVNQWPQFSIGSGVKWIYDRQVLSRGYGGRPSDFGRLLENTWRWLAEPSLKNKAVGGYVTGQQTLLAPNLQKKAIAGWFGGDSSCQSVDPSAASFDWKVYRGLIGAKTAHSSGSGTVAEYAAAAKKAGLQFIVFLEDFAQLTRDKWARLKADCKRFSDSEMTLLPGYAIEANTGDHLFCYGPVEKGHDPWPPAKLLTGPHQTLFKLEPRNAAGQYTAGSGVAVAGNWMIYTWGGHGNLGFYHFSASPHVMRISDLRDYAMAAIRYYKDGRLVEDNTADYLTTAAGTIPPAPISFNEVRSPTELTREVNLGHALTCVQASSVANIFRDGLWWPNQYASYNTFPSDGPIIHAWPQTVRVWTLGAEEFVTKPAIMEAPLQVSAAAGLKEIRIYNGPELFQRWECHGAKQFSARLQLDATIQRNLVLVATDLKGGQAVSFARRCWKDGTYAPIFCSDHVNDCDWRNLLAHGPMGMHPTLVAPLPPDIAGVTWDGGPPAVIRLVSLQDGSRPVLSTNQGDEDGRRFENTPLLDYSDEGATAVASRQDRVFAADVVVANSWVSFGPLAGPGRLMEFVLRLWVYPPPTVGVPETGWPAKAVRQGIDACLFRDDIRFRQDGTVKRLTLLQDNYWLPETVKPVYLLLGQAPATITRRMDCFTLNQTATFALASGDWFALYSPRTACSHIFIVRQQAIQLQVGPQPQSLTIYADLSGKKVRAGDTYTFELFSLGVPVNMSLKSQNDVTRLLNYLHHPEGMKVLRGTPLPSPGFIECEPHHGAVEVVVPRPSWKTNLTLPLRVKGLNRRWTAGLFQKTGYVLGNYGTGENRYRELGVDQFGCAHVPMYVDLAPRTHMVAGHPIIADAAGKDLFIGVMHLQDKPSRWQVSANNPTAKPITTTLRKAMELPGFVFPDTKLTLPPGEYRVLG